MCYNFLSTEKPKATNDFMEITIKSDTNPKQEFP